MKTKNKKVVKAWEERSRQFRDSKKAVMEQAFPFVVNDYIERIHIAEIERILNPRVQKCLDVGCGYGRLAKVITDRHRNVFIYGVDIAPTFVRLFNSKLRKRGRAIIGDIRKLPFEDNFFDAVWVVVSFMYLEKKKDQKKGMAELFRVLKPEGKIVFIEPNLLGVQLVRFRGLIPFLYRSILKRPKVESFGIAFPWKRIDKLILEVGGAVIQKRGYPFFTLLLLPCVVIGRLAPRLVGSLLSMIGRVDNFISSSRFSYFITYVSRKS